MTYILDTTTVSALLRSERGPSHRLLAAAPGDVAIPPPALAELRYGLARLPRSRRRRELEERLRILLEGLERLPWNDEVSRHFGATKAALERRGMRLDDFDLAIAAHALAFDATLVTSNTRHFARIPGLVLEDWAASASAGRD